MDAGFAVAGRHGSVVGLSGGASERSGVGRCSLNRRRPWNWTGLRYRRVCQ